MSFSTVHTIKTEDAALRKWTAAVTDAAVAFEARWTLAALKRVDPDIHRRLVEQRSRFNVACVTGTAADVELQGAALVRGWRAAVHTLEQVAEPVGAYLIGEADGLRVAIGHQKPAARHASEARDGTLWMTPDEVAAILVTLDTFRPIVAVKRSFPGAEIVEVRSERPANERG